MKEKFYSLALRKRCNNDRFFEHKNFIFNELNVNSNRYWIADPFLFEKNGIVYVFYEAYDLICQKGKIGYSVLDPNYNLSKTRIIISEKFHLSFPNIFEYKDNIYIIPESCESDSVLLYKAVNFPNEWKKEKVFIKDIFSCDNIICQKNGKNYLIASEQYHIPKNNKYISCWVKNCLYSLDLDSFSVKECLGILKEGDYGVRNAGNVFYHKGNLVRVGQDCKNNRYGNGLVFWNTLDSMQDDNEVYSIDCNEMYFHLSLKKNISSILGTHTYNSCNKYEIIDFSYIGNISLNVYICRMFYVLARKIYKLIKKIYWRSKRIIKKISNFIKKKINNRSGMLYYSVVDKNAPWVFVSYIFDAFYYKNDLDYLNTHQNKRESIAIVESFNELGFNVCVVNYTATKAKIPENLDCRLIFGHDPNFSRIAKLYPNAYKIWYSVSTYFEYRNNIIREQTDIFNKMYNANVPYSRMLDASDCGFIADDILLIGSDETISTYPVELRGKIKKINQSTISYKYVKNIVANKNSHYFFIASLSNCLKGAHVLFNYFKNRPDLTLHWVGPVENEVKRVLFPIKPNNIHIYGYHNINDNVVQGLLETCDFIIYPSFVEGVPGAVLNSMKSGLIPIVSPYASFDDIERFGFKLESATIESIDKAITWAENLSENEIYELKKKCQKYILDTYNINEFKMEFTSFISSVLGTL